MQNAFCTLFACIRELAEDFRPGVISAYASATAFYILVSFFPFMIVLISVLRFLPFDENTLAILNITFLPKEIESFFVDAVREISEGTSMAVLPIATIGTLWSASKGVYSLTKGLNVIYRRKESRNYVAVRSLCLLYTVAFIVLLILVLSVLVFGNHLVDWLGGFVPYFNKLFFTSWLFRSFVTYMVLVLFFTLLYKTIPNRKSRWFGEVPGALLSAFGWIVFSELYSLYIESFAKYSNVYGSLTAVILFLIWLQACMYMLLFGAHINVTLQKHERLGVKLRK